MVLETKKIIIVNGLNRAGLSVASALKQAGDFKIHFVSTKRSYGKSFKKIFHSYLIDNFDFVKINHSNSTFADQLIEIVAKNGTDIILPIGNAVISISKIKPKLEKSCKVLVEDYDKLIKFHDKSQTLQIASQLGVPHPATRILKNRYEIKTISSEIEYPVVLKARKDTGAAGVWYARDKSELIDLYQRITESEKVGDGFIRDRSNPMVQEYIPGELHDVTAFCINGQMKLGLTQKRLITKPLSGGIGIVNVTTKNEQLLHYARKIIDRVKWNGVMLMDFKIDCRDGQPKLLEINPRFWGTTWLTIKAGLNYPYYLVLNAYRLPVDFPKNYKVGLYCRWPTYEFFTIFEKPYDLLTIIKRFQGFISRFKLKDCVYYLRP